jgi:hypothetical protein
MERRVKRGRGEKEMMFEEGVGDERLRGGGGNEVGLWKGEYFDYFKVSLSVLRILFSLFLSSLSISSLSPFSLSLSSLSPSLLLLKLCVMCRCLLNASLFPHSPVQNRHSFSFFLRPSQSPPVPSLGMSMRKRERGEGKRKRERRKMGKMERM